MTTTPIHSSADSVHTESVSLKRVHNPSDIKDAVYTASLKKVTLYYIVTAFIALTIGVLIGPLQALNYGNINVYPFIEKLIKSYYQGLTLHGILNALVFTQFFISGWMLYLPARDMGIKINMPFAWFTYWMMTIGLLVAAIPLLLDEATILYTLYPPMSGHPAFFLGATVMVAASLLVAGQVIFTWVQWKRQNPNKTTPLVSYMSVATWMMWIVCSLGLVSEALFLLVPWSLGITKGIDPLLAKTLFWWTGHAIVYFWLLPAYISWYAFLPKQIGGRAISEPLTRLVFLMFLLNSTPVGLHHQYADPNISETWKMIHMFLTFLIAVPSFLTAFSVTASMEDAARARGGSGPVAWLSKLPWGNPIFSAQALAMVSFIIGGAGGIVNASSAFGPVVHNTAWIPGHFHITVGTATTMTFMGIAFWLIPHLTGKRLPMPKVANASMWLWFVGMLVFAVGMHWQGLYGVPRRALISATALPIYKDMNLELASSLTAISGVILFISGVMFFVVLYAMLFSKRVDADPETKTPIPYSEVVSPAADNLKQSSPLIRFTEPLLAMWLIGFVLVGLMYGPVVFRLVSNMQAVPGVKLY